MYRDLVPSSFTSSVLTDPWDFGVPRFGYGLKLFTPSQTRDFMREDRYK